jgi:hypothetical protein
VPARVGEWSWRHIRPEAQGRRRHGGDDPYGRGRGNGSRRPPLRHIEPSARSMACMNSATERRSKAPLVGPCPRCDLADTVLHEVPADRGEGEDSTPVASRLVAGHVWLGQCGIMGGSVGTARLWRGKPGRGPPSACLTASERRSASSEDLVIVEGGVRRAVGYNQALLQRFAELGKGRRHMARWA